MADPVTDAHLEAQARVRALTTSGVRLAWRNLPGYDEEDVPVWLGLVVPLVTAAQRQGVSLAVAYVARMLDTPVPAVDISAVVGRVRGAVEPREVYRRPMVTVWSGLRDGHPWEEAVRAGLARAEAAAALDVQMAHREALQATQQAEPRIRGWRRVADADACEFCRMIDGARVLSADAMALHARCGCVLRPETELVEATSMPAGFVHDHGEYGATLGDPSHEHLSEAEALRRS